MTFSVGSLPQSRASPALPFKMRVVRRPTVGTKSPASVHNVSLWDIPASPWHHGTLAMGTLVPGLIAPNFLDTLIVRHRNASNRGKLESSSEIPATYNASLNDILSGASKTRL